ncbi:hypothetical protein TNCV_2482561 [Trichonephila clavipes]|nr:hypothetical protein TNCV_2482561 [Trichonephila clavipes]
MAFLTRRKKEDLRRLAWELGLVVAEDLLILRAKEYEENSIKELFMNIIEERIEKSKLAEQAGKKENRNGF